ncbi:MAG: hypothetical protein WBM87_01050, partial [Woeseiaceae bacterium]
AAFMRVYQKDGVSEAALVLLNKSDDVLEFDVGGWLFPGQWRSADDDAQWSISGQGTPARVTVPAHGAGVYFTNATPSGDVLLADLQRLQRSASR